LPIFMRWVSFMDWLTICTEKFPHTSRHTYAQRLVDLGLEIVADIVAAKFSNKPAPVLKRVNLRLEQLRVFLRLSYNRKFLSHGAYETGSKELVEIGRMLGGWRREVNQRGKKGQTNGPSE